MMQVSEALSFSGSVQSSDYSLVLHQTSFKKGLVEFGPCPMNDFLGGRIKVTGAK